MSTSKAFKKLNMTLDDATNTSLLKSEKRSKKTKPRDYKPKERMNTEIMVEENSLDKIQVERPSNRNDLKEKLTSHSFVKKNSLNTSKTK